MTGTVWALVSLFGIVLLAVIWLAYREHDVAKLTAAVNSQARTIELQRKTINRLLARVGRLEAGLIQLRDESYGDAPVGRHHPESVPS